MPKDTPLFIAAMLAVLLAAFPAFTQEDSIKTHRGHIVDGEHRVSEVKPAVPEDLQAAANGAVEALKLRQAAMKHLQTPGPAAKPSIMLAQQRLARSE